MFAPTSARIYMDAVGRLTGALAGHYTAHREIGTVARQLSIAPRTREVVVQLLPDPGSRVQVSVNGGTEPVWAPDGRRLFYRGSGKIIAAHISTSPTFRVVSRDVLMDDLFQQGLSPHANYDVSPDGKSLLMLQGTDQQSLIMVHNWAAEVRSRLAGRR